MITREKKSRIVDDLARGHRTPKEIADRHGVSVDVVVGLRDELGPELPKLIEAAERLRRPEPITRPEPEPVKPARPNLGPAERAACRAWALSQNRPGARGPLPFDVVDAWLAAGRPEASTYDPNELAPEPDGDEDEAEPEPVTLADVGDRVGADGLTVPERAALRAWASASGRPVGLMGRITGDLVAEWTELGKPTVSDDGVVDVAIVEDEPAADVVEDEPTPLHLAELIKIVLLDVQDLIPYAVVHMRGEVRDLVHAGEQFVEAVRCDQIDRQRVDQLAEVLFDMALRGDLAADRDRLADTARQILAVVDAA